MKRDIAWHSTVLVFLPWLLAAAGVAFGAAVWWQLAWPPSPRIPSERGSEKSPDVSSLRLDMASIKAENDALRREIDRLLTNNLQGGGHGALAEGHADVTPGVMAPEPLADEERRELVRRLGQEMARAAAGDQQGAQDTALTIWEALRSGPAAFETFRETYLNAADPKARAILLAPMLFAQSAEARDFIVSQAQVEADPALRKELLTQAAKYATPDIASQLEGPFIDSLQASDDPEFRLAAVRGLRYARSDASTEALFQVAADRSEELRTAAIEVLASRPGAEEELRALIATESSPRVRQLGECRLLIAGAGLQ